MLSFLCRVDRCRKKRSSRRRTSMDDTPGFRPLCRPLASATRPNCSSFIRDGISHPGRPQPKQRFGCRMPGLSRVQTRASRTRCVGPDRFPTVIICFHYLDPRNSIPGLSLGKPNGRSSSRPQNCHGAGSQGVFEAPLRYSNNAGAIRLGCDPPALTTGSTINRLAVSRLCTQRSVLPIPADDLLHRSCVKSFAAALSCCDQDTSCTLPFIGRQHTMCAVP